MKLNTKQKTYIIYAVILALFLFLAGFGGQGYLNIARENKVYKKSLKELERKNDSLIESFNNLNVNEETDNSKELFWRNKFNKERRLRKQYEKDLFIFRNYSRFYIDSVLSGYKYRGDK